MVKAFVIIELNVEESRLDFVKSLKDTMIELGPAQTVTMLTAKEAEKFDKVMTDFIRTGE